MSGRLSVPGDKSISHRYALLGALARGTTTIDHYAPGDDCASTVACLSALGAHGEIERRADTESGSIKGDPRLTIEGRGVGGFQPPASPLDAGNSGTTMRLLAGILAGHSFESVLTGDASLRRRPMRRVREPLELMGAHITAEHDRPPLTIRGGALSGIEYEPSVPSAQVKSTVLLAGLHATGVTSVIESAPTRDHTERALVAFGVEVQLAGPRVSIAGGQRLAPQTLRVPGDVSSAAFWLAAAAGLPESDLEVQDVGLNPSRTSVLDILRRAGALVDVTVQGTSAGEPYGSVRVRHDRLETIVIEPFEVPGLIDELPVLAALATFGGELHVTGAAELRVKESDRITTLVAGLRALGADAEELPDGFHIRGRRGLTGGTVDAAGDHRLAMAFAVAALGADGPVTITGAEVVDVSYPGFFAVLDAIVREDR